MFFVVMSMILLAKQTRRKKAHEAHLVVAPAKVNPMEIVRNLEGSSLHFPLLLFRILNIDLNFNPI